MLCGQGCLLGLKSILLYFFQIPSVLNLFYPLVTQREEEHTMNRTTSKTIDPNVDQKVESYDVIVVGAGPAGSMAAKSCALGGLKVALVERKEAPSMPVRCGEGVGFKGMNTTIGIKPQWILAQINKVTFISPKGKRVDVHNIGESFCVDRTKMDKDIMEEAVKAGATLINNTYIDTVETVREPSLMYRCFAQTDGNNRVLEAPLLIAADGLESRIRRMTGWPKPFGLDDMESCAIAKVRHPSIIGDTIEFYTGEDIAPGGYLWVFPRGDGFANLGVGVLASRSKPGMAKRLLNKFIKENYEGAEVFDFHAGGVPVGKWINPLNKEGVMIVGDTAGQVNALNGGGIAYALYAGQTAGEVAVEAYSNGAFNYAHLKEYQKRWHSFCGKNQARSYALKSALLKRGNSFYDDVATALEKEDPTKLSYMRVFLRVFIRNPFMLLKTFFLFR